MRLWRPCWPAQKGRGIAIAEQDRQPDSSRDTPGAKGGPLAGVRIIEFEGLGPAPFAGMLLADLGADILRVKREGVPQTFAVENSPIDRGRSDIALDLKRPENVEFCLQAIEKADVLIEGFRPGVMERLGLGPDVASTRNPRLIYARMTGWGQTGPLAETAGHDITYLALTGVLHAVGPAGSPPVPPLNLIGDMGGGGAFLVIGILAALVEREKLGKGQLIDAAITDGVAAQAAIILGMRNGGLWSQPRGRNLLDGGAPFYRTYACADGKFVAAGAIEPKFFKALLKGLDLDVETLREAQYDEKTWPSLHERFEQAFASRPRDHWTAHFEHTDACVAPVLDFDEAAAHPHNRFRNLYTGDAGAISQSRAPRFSTAPLAPPEEGMKTGEQLLQEWGIPAPSGMLA